MDPTKARLDFIRRVEERHFELWKVCCFSQGAMHKMEVSAGVQGKISDCHWSRGWRSLGFCKTTCDRWWHWWSTVLTHWLQQSKLRWDLLREALQCRTEGLIVGGCLTEFCQIHLYIYAHGRVETQMEFWYHYSHQFCLICRPCHRPIYIGAMTMLQGGDASLLWLFDESVLWPIEQSNDPATFGI